MPRYASDNDVSFSNPKFLNWSADFNYPASYIAVPYWYGNGINSGTIDQVGAATLADANHPGIIVISSSSSANSGYRYMSSTYSLKLKGGEDTYCILYVDNATNTRIKFGFQNSDSGATDPYSGAWLQAEGTTVTGHTRKSSGTIQNTSTTYTISEDTWYKFRTTVNNAKTRIDYAIYNMADETLWTDYLITEIPVASDIAMGHGIIVTNSGTSITSLVGLDYMKLENRNLLSR